MAPTALITGVAGQDGTLLAERLVAEGLTVHGTVQSQAELQAWSSPVAGRVTLHVMDVSDAHRVAEVVAAVSPDEVYHLAGISSVAFSWQQPALTGLVTGLGAVHVFAACLAVQGASGHTVRVVQASSAEIFGQPASAPQDEATAIRPVSPYGAAKAYAHQMAAVYRTLGLHVATCIFYNHESPLRPTTFVTRKVTAAAARIAAEGGELVMGSLDARRDWGWAPDYVDAMVRAVRHHAPDDFVIASGAAHSVADLVAAAFAAVGIEDWRAHVRIDQQFVRPTEASLVVGDPSKARRELGWAPTVGFEEMVARMVRHDVALRDVEGHGSDEE